ncbi:hypothetical protein [uncultured Streptomyces sp.]|uniref:hypothetical protein n=1 Tax=uncultured Streptomyces sp. TaxID=174707 RepID=UPI00262449EA|nr:hypothetical protein [uncultured Streptomyces sp.]
MADIAEQDETQQADGKRAARTERAADKLARRIGSFAKEHGGAEGQLAYVGQTGTRIVLVGADGGWGDLMATSQEVAESAAKKSGLTFHDEFDGDFAARVRTGPYEWSRMAGIQVGGPSNPPA